MKRRTLLKKNFSFVPLGFAIPFFCILIMMAINGAYPFGDKSMLYSDGYHQYYPFFKEFRQALLRGDSLLYSWNVGMGIDYLGLIAYYVASPLNLLSVLIPDSGVLLYFSALFPIKIGLAGLFFSIFLNKLFKKNDFSVPLFGSFYALCAWSLGYQWNIMWLDTFALLPLVALGTYSLLKEKKFFLYTISLFFSVFSNYYIGFFTCIFVLLIFICYQICRWESFKKLGFDLGRIALFSILAIGMTAILTLPAFSALQTTQSSVNKYPETFQLNIVDDDTYETAVNSNWKDAKEAWAQGNKSEAFTLGWRSFSSAVSAIADGMKQIAGHTAGATSINHKESNELPNIYCGVITLVFSFLFLTCKQVKLRDKICSVFLLLFISLSFLLRQLDYIWHGFHFTNMIPYRFSFLYSFIMLYMAYRAYLLRKHFKPWQVLVGAGLALILVLLSNSFSAFLDTVSAHGYWAGFGQAISSLRFNASSIRTVLGYLFDLYYPAYNALFIFGVIAILLIGSVRKKFPKTENRQIQKNYIQKFRRRQHIASILLLCLLSVEILCNMVNYAKYWSGAKISDYPKGQEKSEKMFDLMHELEEDTLFYRAETTHAQILNDAALNGYNGISTFTSSANVKITQFMKNLGYGSKETYNRYCFENSSPIPNLFLNLKYTIDRDGFYYEGPIIRRTLDNGEKYTSEKDAYDNPYFDVISKSSLVALAENNAYLPLGFLCEETLADFNFNDNSDQYEFEENLLEAATGLSQDLWYPVDTDLLSITGDENVKITSKNFEGKCRYTADDDGIVTYSFTADREGLFCIDVSQGKRNDFSVWLNNNHDRYPDERIYSETYSLPQMLDVCTVKPGDIVEVQFECSAGDTARIEVYAAILDETAFRNAYQVLSESTLQLTEFSNTFVEGEIDCKKDGLMYTSIPQNGENWKVFVDGKPAETVLVGNVMIGVYLTEGTHTVTFCYENKSFTIGSIITAVCFAAFITLWILFYKPQKDLKKFYLRIKQFNIKSFFVKKGKYDK